MSVVDERVAENRQPSIERRDAATALGDELDRLAYDRELRAVGREVPGARDFYEPRDILPNTCRCARKIG